MAPAWRARTRLTSVDAAVELLDLGEDLDPVARGEHERLADVVALDQLVQRLDPVVGGPWRTARAAPRARSGGRRPPPEGSCRLTHRARCWPRNASTCSSTERSTLRTSTPGGRGERHRREVQDAPHPGRGQPVADRLGHLGRCRDDADGGLRRRDDLLQLVDRAHGLAADALPDAGRRRRRTGRRTRSPGSRSRRSRPARSPRLPDADQHAGAGPLDAQDAGDAVAQGRGPRSRRRARRRGRGARGPCAARQG